MESVDQRSDEPVVGPGEDGECGLRSSASLAEIKFIIKTSILPPTPSVCPSTKKIQRFLQNGGGDSSFEQSMEFKPISARPGVIKAPNSEDKSTDNQRNVIDQDERDTDALGITTECLQNDSSVTVVREPNGEDNKRLAVNLNGEIVDHSDLHVQSNDDCDDNEAEKVLKRAKIDLPPIPLMKSSSSSELAEQKTRRFSLRSISMTPSPRMFRKSYSWSRQPKRSFIRDKLVLPTIVITSTPIKDSVGEVEEGHHSPLSKENLVLFEAGLQAEDRQEPDEVEDMEFSFICEPSESECGDPLNETMDTSVTSLCEALQPALEPVCKAEPSYSLNSMTSDVTVLRRCQSDQTRQLATFDSADVPAFDSKKEPSPCIWSLLEKEATVAEDWMQQNKENEFLVPPKNNKSSTSKRVKSATVRVLQALTVSGVPIDDGDGKGCDGRGIKIK